MSGLVKDPDVAYLLNRGRKVDLRLEEFTKRLDTIQEYIESLEDQIRGVKDRLDDHNL